MNRWTLNLALAVLLLLLAATLSGVFDRASDEQQHPSLIADYDPAMLQSIGIHQDSLNCHLTRQSPTSWRLSEPYAAAISNIALTKLIQLPARRDYQILSDKPANLKQYGLAPALLMLNFDSVSIAWGDINSLDQRRYLLVGDKLILINEDIQPFVQDCPKNLLSKALLEPGQELHGITLPALNVTQQRGEWTMDPAPPSNWSQDDLHRYVDDWRSAQALLVEPLEQSLLGLTPDYRFTLKLARSDIQFLAYRINGQVWWCSPERGLRYYLFDNTLQKLLQPFKPPAS